MYSCSDRFDFNKLKNLTIDVNTSVPLGKFAVNNEMLLGSSGAFEKNDDGVLSVIFNSATGARTFASPVANSPLDISFSFDMEDIKSFLGDETIVNLTNPSIVITVTGLEGVTVTESIMLTLSDMTIAGMDLELAVSKFEVYESANVIIINNDSFNDGDDDLSTAINSFLTSGSTTATVLLKVTPKLLSDPEIGVVPEIGLTTSLEIPLEGTFENITFKDSFKARLIARIDDKLGNDGVVVEKINYRIYADNKFPLDIAVRLYVSDEDGNIDLNDPIGDETIIIAAADNNEPNAEGIVPSRVTDKIYTLEGYDAVQFVEAEYLAFNIIADSKGLDSGELIKLYDGYELELIMNAGVIGYLIVDEFIPDILN